MQHIGSMSGSGSITSARSADLLKRVNALLNDCTVIIADDLALESTVTQRHYCSLILDGLALMRARQLGVSVERIYVAPNVTHTESGSSNDEVLSPPFKIAPLLRSHILPVAMRRPRVILGRNLLHQYL